MSTFKAPDDPQQLKAWDAAIGGNRKLTSKHICKKHFTSDMIRRNKCYEVVLGGEVLLKLLPGAVLCKLLFCPPSPKKKRTHWGPSGGGSQRNTRRRKTSVHDQPGTPASGNTSTGGRGLQENANFLPGFIGACNSALDGNRTNSYRGYESCADASNRSPCGPLGPEEKGCSSLVPASPIYEGWGCHIA